MKGNSTSVIKEANKHLLLDALLKSDALTVEEMIKKTNLSRPTVLKILSKMMADKIVKKKGFRESEGGRKPALYSINRQARYSIGVDIEISPVRLVIVDIRGNIVYSDKWLHRIGDSMDDITDEVIQKISQSIIHSGLKWESVIGINIGIPGSQNSQIHKPRILLRAKSGPSSPFDLKIQEYFNVPVIVENDTCCSARAERESADFKNKEKFIYISYRSGVGMSVYINGKEELGAPSYIGHTCFIPNGLPCECGNRGCLELYCSKLAIIKKYCACKNTETTDVSFNEILDRSKAGDKDATKILEESAECLGIRIADVIKLFDIHTVIIGGSEMDEDSVFYKKIVKTTSANVFDYLRDSLEVLLGSPDEFQSALGASLLAFDRYFSKPQLSLNV